MSTLPRRPAILVLTQVLPYPLDSGPKVRAYHTLTWLVRHADVTLVSFVRADDPPAAVEHLAGLGLTVRTVPIHRSRLRNALDLARAMLTGRSFIILRDGVPAMRRLVAGLLATGRFDAVHSDQLWMAQYALAVPRARGGSAGRPLLRILDNHNAVYRIFERLAAHDPHPLRRIIFRREARLLARYEAACLTRFDRTVFVSATDRDAVLEMLPTAERAAARTRTRVLPICIATDQYLPLHPAVDARRLTVLGTMYWPPNMEGVLWFASEIWPAILDAQPKALLTILGKNPPLAVRDLAVRWGNRVAVTGYVADPRPFLAETAVFLVPLRSGGGMRVKILEAWGWALPVVATTIGAEGIDVRPGEDILLADDPAEFAAAVIALLADPARRRALGQAGRRSVEARYDAPKVYEAWRDVYDTIL